MHQQSVIVTFAGILFASIAQASYVDLYKDADYENKLSRIENIEVDHCYSFACEKLDNTITSTKWGGLPETTDGNEEAMISFYIDRDCQEHDIWWRTRTQSDDDLDFPSNFRLDGINDVISAFMVWNTKKVLGGWDICTTESATIDVGNATSVGASGSGSRTNDTVGSS